MIASRQAEILIEGYAAVFGAADESGDVVRGGAFARSLGAARRPPMLLQHHAGAIAGRWTRIIEDGRGLLVRGLVESPAAQSAMQRGLDGLSIGFRPRLWRPLPAGGRELIDVELVEISLVATPMQKLARLTVLTGLREYAA